MRWVIHRHIVPVLFAAGIVPLVAHAQGTTVNQIIANITETMGLVLRLVFTFAIVVFGWGIVKLIAASGNPQKIKEAKGIILWGIIGMFILASLAGIVAFLQTYFGIPGGGTITPPHF